MQLWRSFLLLIFYIGISLALLPRSVLPRAVEISTYRPFDRPAIDVSDRPPPDPTTHHLQRRTEIALQGDNEAILVAGILLLALIASGLIVGLLQLARSHRPTARQYPTALELNRQYLLVGTRCSWSEWCHGAGRPPPPPYFPRPPLYQDYPAQSTGGAHKDDSAVPLRMESSGLHVRRHSI
ncbi:hypothetical protein FB451DRAFT_1556869 [Mycena latifolia]|nr:hypothetical protein FB451DRAFT_1556869 [Mycena latifolia]